MPEDREPDDSSDIEITPEMIEAANARIVAIVEGRTDTAFNAEGIATEIIEAICEEWKAEMRLPR